MNGKFRRVYKPKIRQVFVFGFIISILLVLIYLYSVTTSRIRELGISPGSVISLITGKTENLKKTSGRTNILLLGMSGGMRAGSDLTDTMIVLSISSDSDGLSLISLPRDIWSDMLRDKINSAFHYGEEKKSGGGITLAKAAVEEILGIPVHYGIVIDFEQFVRVIDTVGGVDVAIDSGFTDTQYPVDGMENDVCEGDPLYGCRYKTVTFEKGIEHMNGSRALIYVRSRHAEGSDGNDFSRNRRQQEILFALKNRIIHQKLSWYTLSHVQSLKNIIDTSTTSDMNTGEIVTIGMKYLRSPDAHVRRIQIDNFFTEGTESQFGGRYVLIPLKSQEDLGKFIATSVSELK